MNQKDSMVNDYTLVFVPEEVKETESGIVLQKRKKVGNFVESVVIKSGKYDVASVLTVAEFHMEAVEYKDELMDKAAKGAYFIVPDNKVVSCRKPEFK